MEFWISSRNIGAIYPGLYDQSLECGSVYIGRERNGRPFFYNPFELYSKGKLNSPNIMVFGQIGYGKSALVKALVSRHLQIGYRGCVLDPKGEYVDLSSSLGGQTYSFGKGGGTGLNPLGTFGARASVIDGDQKYQVLENLVLTTGAALGREITPLEAFVLEEVLWNLLSRAGIIDMYDIYSSLVEIRNMPGSRFSSFEADAFKASGQLALQFRRFLYGDLRGIIDGKKDLDQSGFVSSFLINVDLFSALHPQSMKVGVPIFLALFSRELSRSSNRYLIALDEAWLALSSPGCIEFFRSYWKLARGYGISNIAVVHRSEDLISGDDSSESEGRIAQGLISDSQTFVIFHLDPAPAKQLGHLLKLSNTEINIISALPKGGCLWKVSGQTFLVDVELNKAELDLFNTDKRMLSDSHQ